jgi:hypothetical protein
MLGDEWGHLGLPLPLPSGLEDSGVGLEVVCGSEGCGGALSGSESTAVHGIKIVK